MLKRRDFIGSLGAGLALAAGAPLQALAQGKPGLIPGRGVYSAPGLSFSALYVAKREGRKSAYLTFRRL